MPISRDMTGSGGSNFDPIPEGMEPAVIKACKYHAKSQASGKPYLEFEFALQNHPNRKLWRNYSLQPNALWALKETLTVLGIDVPDEGEFEFEPNDVIGLECVLEVGLRPHYRDPEREDNEVVKIHPADSSAAAGW